MLDDAGDKEERDEKYVEMIEEKKNELEEPANKEDEVEPSPKTQGNDDGD